MEATELADSSQPLWEGKRPLLAPRHHLIQVCTLHKPQRGEKLRCQMPFYFATLLWDQEERNITPHTHE